VKNTILASKKLRHIPTQWNGSGTKPQQKGGGRTKSMEKTRMIDG